MTEDILLISFVNNPNIIRASQLYIVKKVCVIYTGDQIDRFHQLRQACNVLNIDVDGHIIRDNYLQLILTINKATEGNWKLIVVDIAGVENPMTVAIITIACLIRRECVIIGEVDGQIIQLPLLKLGLVETISDAKMKLLESLKDEPLNLTQISKKTNIDKSLISYHINGGKTSLGLIELGLVEKDRSGPRGSVFIKLTDIGRVISSADRIDTIQDPIKEFVLPEPKPDPDSLSQVVEKEIKRRVGTMTAPEIRDSVLTLHPNESKKSVHTLSCIILKKLSNQGIVRVVGRRPDKSLVYRKEVR